MNRGTRKYRSRSRSMRASKLFTLLTLAVLAIIDESESNGLTPSLKPISQKCKYNKARVTWSACDLVVHVKTKVAHLVQGRRKCPKTRTYTKPCHSGTVTMNGCVYIQVTDWSECDLMTKSMTRTLELKSGNTALCDNTRLESRECPKKDVRDKIKGSKKRQRKNKRKNSRRKQKRKNKGCGFRTTEWSTCDLDSGLQFMRRKLRKSSDPTKCESFVLVHRPCLPDSDKPVRKKGDKTKSKNLKGKSRKSSKRKRGKKKKDRTSSKRTKKKDFQELSQEPPRLTELTVVPYTNFAVLTWKPPQQEESGRPVAVEGYLIGYGRGFPDVHSITVNASTFSYRIENLEPGGEYVISIRALNQMGIGQALYDTVMTRDTIEGASRVLVPPVGVQSKVLSQYAINVSWVDLSIKGEIDPDPRTYYLRYRPLNHFFKGSGPYQDHFKTLGTTDTFKVVNGLLPYTKYEFVVLTSSGKQNSTWSIMVWNITEQDVPTQPPKDITVIRDPDTPRDVIVSWQPPTTANGIITGYEVLYYTHMVDGTFLNKSVEVIGNRLSTTLTSLIPGLTYNISVAAINIKGKGPSVNTENYKLPGDPAPVPAKLKASWTNENPRAVALHWKIPEKTEAEVLGFVIFYTTDVSTHPVHWEVEARLGKDLKMAVIENLQPSTKYYFKIQVHTTAGYGPESNTVMLETAAEDDKEPEVVNLPTNLRVKILSSTSAVISWQDPSLAKVFEMQMPYPNPIYSLRYRRLTPEPGSYKEISLSFPSLYLDDLQPLTEYEFSVKVKWGKSRSKWTLPVVKTTLASDFSQIPLKVEVKGQRQTPSRAILSWLPHSEDNIKEYVIMYSIDPRKPHKQWIQKAAVNQDVKQQIFYDLKLQTTYYFFVQAMTDIGFGPRSNVVSYRTPKESAVTQLLEKPERLQALMVSSNSAVLSWRDPNQINLADMPKEIHHIENAATYSIRYKSMNAKSSSYKYQSSSSLSAFLVNLTPSTNYEFSVKVSKGSQHSPWSNTVINSTYDAAPGSPPHNLTVTIDRQDPTSVLLSWSPPHLPNGVISGYTIFYTTNPSQSIKKALVKKVSGEAHSLQISFLQPKTNYYFKIRAKNSKGFSPLSPYKSYKTPRVIGNPPQDLSIVPSPENPYNAVISWQPPSPNNRKILNYTLTHYTEEGKERVVEEIPGSMLTTTVKQLKPSTTYHFTVQAYYKRGAGPPSEISMYSIPKELL